MHKIKADMICELIGVSLLQSVTFNGSAGLTGSNNPERL